MYTKFYLKSSNIHIDQIMFIKYVKPAKNVIFVISPRTDLFRIYLFSKCFTEWSSLVSSHLIEVINKSENIDLSQSWMNELRRILKSGIETICSINEDSSMLDIVAMERNGWENVCRSIPPDVVTTFLRLTWQVLYFSQVCCIFGCNSLFSFNMQFMRNPSKHLIKVLLY